MVAIRCNCAARSSWGDQEVLFVSAPSDRRWYWRSRVFERYDGGNWTPSATLRVADFEPPLEVQYDAASLGDARASVTQTFTIANTGLRLIHTAPQPLTVDVEGRIDPAPHRRDRAAADGCVGHTAAPRAGAGAPATPPVSQVSIATADQLRQAGDSYPAWISNPDDPNLYVSSTISPRVLQYWPTPSPSRAALPTITIVPGQSKAGCDRTSVITNASRRRPTASTR